MRRVTRRRRPRAERGFTMTELLVTMLILTIVLTGLAAMQIHVIRQVSSSRKANEAMRLCQAQIERYKTMSFAEVRKLETTPPRWETETNEDGDPMIAVTVTGKQGVSKAGTAVSGPYTVQRLVESLTIGTLATVRVSWLDSTRGSEADPTAQYRTLDVVMSTQRSQ